MGRACPGRLRRFMADRRRRDPPEGVAFLPPLLTAHYQVRANCAFPRGKTGCNRR